jgi:hypothetical protein
MSQPPDEEDDQIFSGTALGEDGALRPAKPIPLLNEIPRAPGESLLDDPAYEPTVISIPPQVRTVPDRPERVELADRAPPPMESDFVPIRPEKPVRYSSPDLRWGRWILRAALLGLVVAGVWVVTAGRLPIWKGFSFDLLRSGSDKEKEEVKEKRVGTPAPTLLVLSDPAGATVLVGGTEVGITPWAGDNVWPKEPLRIEVRKAGYKPWVGLTMGGQQATLEATLRRR